MATSVSSACGSQMRRNGERLVHRFREGVAEHQSQHSTSCTPGELAALQEHALRRAATFDDEFMTGIVPTTGAEASNYVDPTGKEKEDGREGRAR